MAEEEKKELTEETTEETTAETTNEGIKELTEDELLAAKKKKMMIIIIGLVALLILLMIGGYFLFIKDDEVPLAGGGDSTPSNTSSTEISSTKTESDSVATAEPKTAPEPVHEHTRGEWVVAKEATCSEKGTEQEICPECEEVLDEREIPTTAHKWVDVTEVVHHDAVTEERWVQDREAYDETIVDRAATEEGWECESCHSRWPNDQEMEAHQHECPATEEFNYNIIRIEAAPAQTHVEHHEAQGHMETFTVQEAYDETVVTGQRCSECGARK